MTGRRIPPRRIPIVAVTAHALAEMRQKCIDAGMDDFVTKPFDELQLTEALLRHLQPLGVTPAAIPVIGEPTMPDAMPARWGGLADRERVADGLKALCEADWVASKPIEAGASGGRSTVQYRPNPKALIL